MITTKAQLFDCIIEDRRAMNLSEKSNLLMVLRRLHRMILMQLMAISIS